MAMGGIFNIDSPNTISGAGSVADQDDSQYGVTESSPLTGTLTGPDSFGSLTLASYGQFTADSSGNLSAGYDDEALSFYTIYIGDSFTGTYMLDANGTGRVDSTITCSNPSNGAGPELIFYLTGNGNPPLVLDADDSGNSMGFGSIGIGVAHPQAVPPFSFSGRFGVEFVDSTGTQLNTATGQIAANGSARTLSDGLVDTNYLFGPLPNTELTGTFSDIPTSGRFTGTLVNTLFPSPTNFPGGVAVAFYPVDDNLIFFTETDLLVTGQATFGRFVTRTPVCSVCQ